MSSGHPPFSWMPIPLRELPGSPEFKFASFHACHGFEPRRTRFELTNCARNGADFQYVHTVVIRFKPHYGAKLPLGTATPLRPAWFPVYASSMPFHHPSVRRGHDGFRFRPVSAVHAFQWLS